MINIKNINLLPRIFLLLLVFDTQAQTSNNIDYRSERTMQYLDINIGDEKSMLKLSPDYYVSSHFSNLSLYLSYEKKIRQQFSFAVNNASYFNVASNAPFVANERVSKKIRFYNSTGISFRHYFTMARRMREGVSGNNLNGLYTELELLNLVNLYDRDIKDLVDKNILDVPDPKIAVGLQKRLNRWSYVDVYASVQYTHKLLISNLGFRIGIAL